LNRKNAISSKTLIIGIIICFILLSPSAFAITKEKMNHPPDKPDKPSGPNKVKSGVTYSFTAVTTDPDNDYLSYLFDWGDGTYSEWTYPFVPSGTNVSESHKWHKSMTGIRVKAKDFHGAQSEWSEPFIPGCTGKGEINYPFLQQFLEKSFLLNMIFYLITKFFKNVTNLHVKL